MSHEHQLAALRDDLIETITAIENTLSLRYSVPAEVPFPEYGGKLSFRRREGRWQLCVQKVSHDVPQTFLLRDAKVRTRIAAIQHLPALQNALEEKEGPSMEEMRAATAEARKFLESIREGT